MADGPDPAELMRVLAADLHQLRVGNSAPEAVPVFQDPRDAARHYVRFADLSTNVRHILDLCPDVEIRVDGDRFQGNRTWRDLDGRRGPVLEWTDLRPRS